MKNIQVKVFLKNIGNSFMSLNASNYFTKVLGIFNSLFQSPEHKIHWDSWTYTHEITLNIDNIIIEIDLKPVYGSYPDNKFLENSDLILLTNDPTLGSIGQNAEYTKSPKNNKIMELLNCKNAETFFSVEDMAEFPAILVFEILSLILDFSLYKKYQSQSNVIIEKINKLFDLEFSNPEHIKNL